MRTTWATWIAVLSTQAAAAPGIWINPPQSTPSSDRDDSMKMVYKFKDAIDLHWRSDLDWSPTYLLISQQSRPRTEKCIQCGKLLRSPLAWKVDGVKDMFSLSTDPLDYVFFFTLSNGTERIKSQGINITQSLFLTTQSYARQPSLGKRASRRKKGLSEQMKWCIGLIAGVGGGFILGILLVYWYKWSMKKQGRPVEWPDPPAYGGS